MFWWFERGGQYLRCETREAAAGRFELRLMRPDGSEQVENFDDPSHLTRRQLEVERDLTAEGWTGPHGWHL